MHRVKKTHPFLSSARGVHTGQKIEMFPPDQAAPLVKKLLQLLFTFLIVRLFSSINLGALKGVVRLIKKFSEGLGIGQIDGSVRGKVQSDQKDPLLLAAEDLEFMRGAMLQVHFLAQDLLEHDITEAIDQSHRLLRLLLLELFPLIGRNAVGREELHQILLEEFELLLGQTAICPTLILQR